MHRVPAISVLDVLKMNLMYFCQYFGLMVNSNYPDLGKCIEGALHAIIVHYGRMM
jgi:hypothetical protein